MHVHVHMHLASSNRHQLKPVNTWPEPRSLILGEIFIWKINNKTKEKVKINLLREIKTIIISGLFAVMRNSCFALNITLRRFVQKVQKKKKVGVKKTLQRKNRFTNRLSLRQIKKKNQIQKIKSAPLEQQTMWHTDK